MVVCGIAEPCGAIIAGVTLTAGAGGLLAGVSARVAGLQSENGLAAAALTGGLISGASGGAGVALDLSGAPAVALGTISAATGGFSADLAGQAVDKPLNQLNMDDAAVSGATSALGYFGGGSFAVDALGVPASSAAGLATSANGAVIGTAGVVIVNH